MIAYDEKQDEPGIEIETQAFWKLHSEDLAMNNNVKKLTEVTGIYILGILKIWKFKCWVWVEQMKKIRIIQTGNTVCCEW